MGLVVDALFAEDFYSLEAKKSGSNTKTSYRVLRPRLNSGCICHSPTLRQ